MKISATFANERVKSLFCLLALLLCVTAVRAESPGLETCGEQEVVVGYQSQVDSLIDDAVAGKRGLRFTVFPSFTSEWGVRMVERDGRFFVAHVALQESVWGSSWQAPKPDGRVDFVLTTADIPVDVHEAEIGEALAHRLTARVTTEIERAQVADGFGRDGVTYYFRASDSRCAETWSPEPGTRQAKLVAVIQGLAEVAHASRWRSRARAVATVEGLLAELAEE